MLSSPPRTRPARLFWKCVLLGLALPLLSGCVYLRLLKFKNQLKDFDAHMEVDRSSGLSLVVREPVLRDEDFTFLTESEPTHIERIESLTSEISEAWTWRFEKEPEDASSSVGDAFAIYFITRFEDGLLYQVDFDRRLIEVLPPEFIVELFKSMGRAKVNKLRRSAASSIDADDIPGVPLPSLADIQRVMGEPSAVEAADILLTWRYTFNFHNPETGETAGQFKLAFKSDDRSQVGPISGFEVSGKAK